MRYRRRRPRIRMFLAAHPTAARGVLRALGARRVERMGQRHAIEVARHAFERVPYYRALYEQHGFDAQRMRRLTWAEFQQLPSVGKAETLAIADRELMDTTLPSPAADAALNRSSGTTRAPIFWPAGWDEFYVTRSHIQHFLEDLGADRTKTAIVLAMPVDGAPTSGNFGLRIFFSAKEHTCWPFEVIPAGEAPDTIISILQYVIRERFEILYLMSFPGTIERLLNRLAELDRDDPAAAIDWDRFTRKRVLLSGQASAYELRERIRRELRLDPRALDTIQVALGSSDTGQLVAQSTPFTQWLERFMTQHPQVAGALGIPEEHWTKSLLEFAPSIAIYLENDPVHGILISAWKHRPLVRYRSNDLAWLRPVGEIIAVLDRTVRDWRKDMGGYGLRRRDVPYAVTIGMMLGRADDIRIVNGANISPELLRGALDAAGILPRIRHFKHDADDTRPNEYFVYLELPDARSQIDLDLLAATWAPSLLETLVALPGATDLLAAHRANPITLRLFVRSRGEDEFAGDELLSKTSYVPRRSPTVPKPAPAGKDQRDQEAMPTHPALSEIQRRES